MCKVIDLSGFKTLVNYGSFAIWIKTESGMKKAILLVIVALMWCSSNIWAQSNIFKLNIVSPIVRTASVFYERTLNDQSSLQMGFFYSGYSDDETKYRGFGVTPEYRFYLSETLAPSGFYVAPFLRYQAFDLEDKVTADEATYSSFGGGLLIGRQWVFKQRVALDLFLGPSYFNGDVEAAEGSGDEFDVEAFDGFGLRTGITLGLAF